MTLKLADIGEPHMNSLGVVPSEIETEKLFCSSESEQGAYDFWRSSTLLIDTKNLSTCSFSGEVLSSIRLDSLIILCFVCGVGYQGRLTISKWFGILETIHHWPVAIAIAAFADS